MKKKETRIANDYNLKNHVIGKIWMACALAIFFSVPATICIYYGVTPNMAVMASPAVLIPFIINFISGIVEPIIYSPMLGTNSAYLAFITGNLSNLKIPCVVKAQEICDTKIGTEENEVVATLSVAVSTLVTTLIIAVFVLILAVSNLRGAIMANEWIMPAFTCVVYALFGSLGGKYVVKNIKLAFLPLVSIVVLSIILGVCKLDVGSAYLFVGIALSALFAGLQIARQKKKQKAQQEQERLERIASEEVEIIPCTADDESEKQTQNDSDENNASDGNEKVVTDESEKTEKSVAENQAEKDADCDKPCASDETNE